VKLARDSPVLRTSRYHRPVPVSRAMPRTGAPRDVRIVLANGGRQRTFPPRPARPGAPGRRGVPCPGALSKARRPRLSSRGARTGSRGGFRRAGRSPPSRAVDRPFPRSFCRRARAASLVRSSPSSSVAADRRLEAFPVREKSPLFPCPWAGPRRAPSFLPSLPLRRASTPALGTGRRAGRGTCGPPLHRPRIERQALFRLGFRIGNTETRPRPRPGGTTTPSGDREVASRGARAAIRGVSPWMGRMESRAGPWVRFRAGWPMEIGAPGTWRRLRGPSDPFLPERVRKARVRRYTGAVEGDTTARRAKKTSPLFPSGLTPLPRRR